MSDLCPQKSQSGSFRHSASILEHWSYMYGLIAESMHPGLVPK
jgi:hypothetical protein